MSKWFLPILSLIIYLKNNFWLKGFDLNFSIWTLTLNFVIGVIYLDFRPNPGLETVHIKVNIRAVVVQPLIYFLSGEEMDQSGQTLVTTLSFLNFNTSLTEFS